MKDFKPCIITPEQAAKVHNQPRPAQQLEAKHLNRFTGVDAHLTRLQLAFESEFQSLINALEKNGITYTTALECYPYVQMGTYIIFSRGQQFWMMPFFINEGYTGTRWPPEAGECYDWAKWQYHKDQTPYPWPLSGFVEEIKKRFSIDLNEVSE